MGRSSARLASGFASALLLAASTARAAIITVTGTGDALAVDGFVTLREAITAANTNAAAGDAPAGDSGLDTIRFNIAGAPGTVHTIQPLSALPTITDPIVIDGYSQLGANPNTLVSGTNAFLAIDLDGSSSGFNAGLTISAGASTVQGLVIEQFKNEGILILGAGGNVIRGNFLGTDQTGTLDRGNGISGVSLLSDDNVVGGTAPADRNLISGNDFAGVVVNAGVSGNRIEGNYIGTDDSGSAPLPNTGAGVRLVNAADNTVGGAAAGAGNVITFNTGEGVRITGDPAIGNEILGNAIADNGGLGIDLGGDGVTANDPSGSFDSDPGPNGLQNFPVLTGAERHSGGATLAGELSSAASTEYRVELFTSPDCDTSGHGEGSVFLGAQDVTTGADGEATFVFETPVGVPVGEAVTATATAPDGSTSEHSACALVSAADPCGNGFVDPGEACDDGSGIDDPCCAATCQPAPAGTACNDDGVTCTTDACDAAGACLHTAVDIACPACRQCDATAGCVVRPRTDCRHPGRATLALANKSLDARDRLSFVWKRGAATTPADFGTLPGALDYTLCLFDTANGANRLVADTTIPAGAGWKERGKGFRYRSRGGAPDGVTHVLLKSGDAGKAKATVTGKGAALGLESFPLGVPVTAQLQAGGNDGACFAATFAMPTKSSATTFRAKGQ